MDVYPLSVETVVALLIWYMVLCELSEDTTLLTYHTLVLSSLVRALAL